MKYIIYSLLIINIAAIGGFAQKISAPPRPLIYQAPASTDFKEFVAEDKSYKIVFPGVPKISKNDLDQAIVMRAQMSRKGSNSSVIVYEFKNEIESGKDKIFSLYKDIIEKKSTAQIESERDLEIEGFPAKEFDVTEDLEFRKIRLIVIGKRIYEIMSDVTNWHILKEFNKEKALDFENEATRFFESFKVLDTKKEIQTVPVDFLGISGETSYANNFFGFSFDFPADWYNLEPSEIEAGRDSGLKALKTNKERIDRTFAEAAKKEVIIFAVSKKKFGETGGDNLVIGVIKLPSGQIGAADVLTNTKELFLANPKIKIYEDLKNVQIKGVKFSTITFESMFGTTKVIQKLYLTVIKGYAVSFTISYVNDEGQKALETIIESLKFNSK